MYRAATADDELRFGDIVEAEWIFDLVLRADAKALSYQTLPGGSTRRYLLPEERSAMVRERQYPKDLVLAHADPEALALGHGNVDATAARAVVVSDDCDLEEARRRPRGRLRLAGLVALPTNENVRREWLATEAFDRFPLVPQTDLVPAFQGGVIEFLRTFAVAARDLLDIKPSLVIADDQDRQNLLIRWAAHAARRGPGVATQAAVDLVRLLIANGDEELAQRLRQGDQPLRLSDEDKELIRQLQQVASLNWKLEGGNVDQIADGLERGDAPDEHLERTTALLERLAQACTDAAAALGVASTRRGPR